MCINNTENERCDVIFAMAHTRACTRHGVGRGVKTQVSWVKREPHNDNLQLLTVGMQTYSGDSRFSVEFQYPNNWRLRIVDANKSDEGQYECQISTYPPRVITTYFQVHCKFTVSLPLFCVFFSTIL